MKVERYYPLITLRFEWEGGVRSERNLCRVYITKQRNMGSGQF